MKNLKCIIVDDEPLAVELLANYANRTEALDVVGTFTDAITAADKIRELKPDLLFLDIQMPDLNGLELAKLVQEDTHIIFTTAFKEYAFESYEVEAIDYILKPVQYRKFYETVLRAQKRIQKEKHEDTVFIRTDREYKSLAINDILYISGMKDYVVIHLISGNIVAHITMKAMEEMLPKEKFMRVHRSHIIAIDKISSINPTGDIFINGEVIPFSESYRSALEKLIQERLISGS